MTAKQVLNVAYAAMTEGAGEEARATFDGILEGTHDEKAQERKQNREALKSLGVPVGTVK